MIDLGTTARCLFKVLKTSALATYVLLPEGCNQIAVFAIYRTLGDGCVIYLLLIILQLTCHFSRYQIQPDYLATNHLSQTPIMSSTAAQAKPLQGIVVLPATILLLSSIAFLPLELYAIQMYENGLGYFDWTVESMSDLGVDYRQVHPLKHYNVTSYRYAIANANFIQAGVAFAVAQLTLLFLTRKNATSDVALLRTIRTLLALFFAVGLTLMALIHGGPREKFWNIIGWHWNGMALAAIAGNLNSILAATKPGQLGSLESSALYRLPSLALGVFGLFSYYQFMTLGEWDYQTKVGGWQRASLYPIFAWELLTAIGVFFASSARSPSKPKRV